MSNKPLWLKVYSVLFIMSVFVIFLGQLCVPGITISSISQNYLWKKDLVKKYNYFKYQIGDRVFANVVVGKEGWLYFTGDMSIRDYQKIDPLNMGNIKRLTKILNKIKEQTNQYGGMFLLVVPPDKSTVYPQYMPDEIPVLGQISSLDRLVEYLNKNSNIQILDLRPVLFNASKNTQIYYKTDTHWNCLGGFYASNEILSRISISHPQIQPHPLNDFEFSSMDSVLDIPLMMGLEIKEDRLTVTPKYNTGLSVSSSNEVDSQIDSLKITVNDNKNLPTLMVFHDSFYGCLSIFVEPNFKRTVSMPFKDAELIEYLDIISSEKPDIVIVEFVERYMDFLYGHLSN